MIVDLPPEKVSPTHACVLRFMFGHGGVGRFLLFYGSVGVAVLREAFVEFPKRLPQSIGNDHYVQLLGLYAEAVLAKNEFFHLT